MTMVAEAPSSEAASATHLRVVAGAGGDHALGPFRC
jgi:hypothetical protein